MCSFPFLEDFALLSLGYGDEVDRSTTPSTSPRLTGTLDLSSRGRAAGIEIGLVTRRLLDLPGGLNFTKVRLSCMGGRDFESATDSVVGCSNTLKSLDVVNYLISEFPSVHVPDQCLTSSRRASQDLV